MAGLPDENVEYTFPLTVSCVENTAVASYLTTSVPQLNQVMLWSMTVRIPPGHAGVTGLALVDSGSFILPFPQQGTGWFIGDDDKYDYNYGKQTGANVQVAYYNTSTTYTHGWVLYFVYTPMSDLTAASGAIVVPNLANTAQAIEATTGGG